MDYYHISIEVYFKTDNGVIETIGVDFDLLIEIDFNLYFGIMIGVIDPN